MISISENFKDQMKAPMKEIDAYISTDAEEIKSDGDLISYKITCNSGLCKTAMRKIDAKILGNHDLLGKWVNVGFGVRLENNSFEYLDYGSFLITEISTSKDTETTQIVGYDKMINAMKEYTPLDIEYPINLFEYVQKICEACDLELANDSIINGTWQITQDLWTNISGITYRDILVQIAQATGSTCIINNENKVLFKYITLTNEELTYDTMKKLKLNPIYGEINSVVLGRDPISGEDVYLKDDTSIEENGLTEFRISNNEIIDKNRELAIIPIYNILKGIAYYPFETTTTGLGWYEIGDKFSIVNDTGNTYECVLFNYSITIDGAITEILKTEAETKTQSQYQYATSIGKRVKNTEIIVNKQEEYIQQLVSDMYDENGVVNENFAKIFMDLQNILMSVQNSGGNNLVKNSVGFAGTSEWELTYDNEDTSNIETLASVSLLEHGVSGGAFRLNGVKLKQEIIINPNTDYSFSCIVSKKPSSNGYIKLYNPNNSEESWVFNFEFLETIDFKKYEIKGEINVSSNKLVLEYYGDEDSDLTITDTVITRGDLNCVWTQANGEILNTQVNINLDGVLVKSLQFDETGQYTVISPQEFAGYANKNGISTRVFTLNGDTTEVEKLRAISMIAMYPLKMVPITSGSNQGVAFVPDDGGN